MDITKEEQQRQEFRSLLLDLATSQTLLEDKFERYNFYQRLEGLYYSPDGEDKGFRHYYSDIFSVLVQIKQDEKFGSIDVLGQNLGEIRKGYQPKNQDVNGKPINISDKIRKLYDHVSLDIARMQYSDAGDRKLSQEQNILNIKHSVSEVQNNVNIAKDDLKKEVQIVKDSVHNVQKEYIAILGIFASVVLTFAGAFSFSTSIFSNLHQSSIYRIILAALIIGLVLTNILYVLFYYIDRLVNKKEERQIKPLLIVDGILVVLILGVCLFWILGLVEQRNLRISASSILTHYLTYL